MNREQVKDLLEDKTFELIKKGFIILKFDDETSERILRTLKVSFFYTGHTAGRYLDDKERPTIKYNLAIAATNFDAFVNRTLIHEVAHLLTEWKYGERITRSVKVKKGRRVVRETRHWHDAYWQNTMRRLGADDTSRVYDEDEYDLSNVKVKKRQVRHFVYECKRCGGQYEVGAKRHKRWNKRETETGHTLCYCLSKRCKYLPAQERELFFVGEKS